MVRKAILGALAAIVVAAALVGIGVMQGWIGNSGGPPPPTVSPVTVTFSPCQHLVGHWVANVTSVTSAERYGSYRVSLSGGPSNLSILTNATVHPDYIGGNGDVSLFYEDRDDEGNMTAGDDFYVGGFGPGPYIVYLFWVANGALVATIRCS